MHESRTTFTGHNQLVLQLYYIGLAEDSLRGHLVSSFQSGYASLEK